MAKDKMVRVAIEVENVLYGMVSDLSIVWVPHGTISVQIIWVWRVY